MNVLLRASPARLNDFPLLLRPWSDTRHEWHRSRIEALSHCHLIDLDALAG